jgi:hypothetical protein
MEFITSLAWVREALFGVTFLQQTNMCNPTATQQPQSVSATYTLDTAARYAFSASNTSLSGAVSASSATIRPGTPPNTANGGTTVSEANSVPSNTTQQSLNMQRSF